MDIVAVLAAVAALLLSVVYVAKFWVRRAKLHSVIDKIPGPPAYPIIGTTYKFIGVPKHKLLDIIHEYSRQYGPVFRIWLGRSPEIILMKPQHFEAILSGTKHLEKSSSYRFLKLLLGNGLVTSSGSQWHAHRKIITPAFHLSILDSFIEVFSEKCDILMEILEEKANGSAFDIYPYVTRCTLDIICETAMGVSVHAQTNPDTEYLKAASEMPELVSRRRDSVWLHPDIVFHYSPTGRKSRKCMDIIKVFTRKVVQERRAALSSAMKISHESSDEDRSFGIRRKKAFLDLLLEITEKEGKMSDEELREEVDTFMIAGHETTSTSASWALFLLGHHPDIQEKVYAELSEIFQGSQRSPTMKDLHEMKYLERVIKEALRLYPTVPLIQRVLSEDVRIDGYDIPAGTTVSIAMFLANRNPEYFPNPDQFDPDNFLPERVQNRHHFAFVPFSAGPRNCIGQRFAMLEEKTILSSILRKFKVRSLEEKEDIKPVPAVVLRPEHGIKLTLTSRTLYLLCRNQSCI